jgi:hypothetical protein
MRLGLRPRQLGAMNPTAVSRRRRRRRGAGMTASVMQPGRIYNPPSDPPLDYDIPWYPLVCDAAVELDANKAIRITKSSLRSSVRTQISSPSADIVTRILKIEAWMVKVSTYLTGSFYDLTAAPTVDDPICSAVDQGSPLTYARLGYVWPPSNQMVVCKDETERIASFKGETAGTTVFIKFYVMWRPLSSQSQVTVLADRASVFCPRDDYVHV